MKEKTKSFIISVLLITLLFVLAGCEGKKDHQNLLGKIKYSENTVLGEGSSKIFLKVKTDANTVEFTIYTDRKYLGDALIDNDLISGEEGAYGLYIKSVNGITADYDKDKRYWAFYKDGDYMLTGVDGTEIHDGEHYELVYAK